MEAYHISPTIHSVGRSLNGNGLPKVEKEIEDALERHRPRDCLDRLNSVYAVATPDFSMLGVESGYIYRVEIGDDFQRHNAHWIGQLQLAHLKQKHSQKHEYIAEAWPDWTEDFVSLCCIKYWTGEASKKPLWELLSKTAEVKAQLSTTIVQSGSTKSGWQMPNGVFFISAQ